MRPALWLAHYNAQPVTRAIAQDASEQAPAARLLAACRDLAPPRGGMAKPLRVLICGIPNVGKSTLINTLMGKPHAWSGHAPGEVRLNPVSLASSPRNCPNTRAASPPWARRSPATRGPPTPGASARW